MTKLFLDNRTPANIPPLEVFTVSAVIRPGEMVDGVMIVWAGEHLREHVLHAREGPVPATTLYERVLGVEGCDLPIRSRYVNQPGIVDELGGQDMVNITFGQYWWYLTHADRARWYTSYVLVDGKLYGVHAGWTQGGLHIESGPFGRSHSWAKGCVFLVP